MILLFFLFTLIFHALQICNPEIWNNHIFWNNPKQKMFGIISTETSYFFSRDTLTLSIRPSSIESTSMRSGQNLSISPSRGNLSSRSMIR